MKIKKTSFGEELENYRDAIFMHHLQKAFGILREQIVPLLHDGNLREEALTVSESYDLMLEAFARNQNDPDRARMYEQMEKWSFEIWERLQFYPHEAETHNPYFHAREEWLKHHSIQPDFYQETLESCFTRRKMLNPKSKTYKQELFELSQEEDEALDNLFNQIWYSCLWTEQEAHQVSQLMESPAISQNVRVTATSAIVVALTHHFDERKYLQLVGLCCHPSLQVSQRALVGVCLTLFIHYENRTTHYTLWDVLAMLSELPKLEKRLQTIQLEFVNAAAAMKLSQHIQENCIPLVTREDSGWEEAHEWLREGADIYLSSFRHLKGFPFFAHPAHWFYLFDPDDCHVQSILNRFLDKQSETMHYLMQSVVFCDADKYSFCFTLDDMNESQLGMLVGQLEEQREAVMDQVVYQDSIRRRAEGMKEITGQFVQELNRFFKCYAYRGNSWDPFAQCADFWHLDPIRKLTADDSFTTVLINQLRKWEMTEWPLEGYPQFQEVEEFHLESLKTLIDLNIKNGANPRLVVYQLRQMIKEEREPQWAIRRLAKCVRMKKMEPGFNITLTDLEVYEKWLEMEPDNEKAATQYGKILLEAQEYEKALPYLHRWEFAVKNPLNPFRALTWALLNLQRIDEAKRYSQRVFTFEEHTFDDWVNAGHIAMVEGNVQEALRCYRTAIPLAKPSWTSEDIILNIEDVNAFVPKYTREFHVDMRLMVDTLERELKN
jgi:tetratricopeptide (TPR) repeat protein